MPSSREERRTHYLRFGDGRGRKCLLCVAFWLLPVAGCSQATPTPTGRDESCPDQLDELRDPTLTEVVGSGLVAGSGRVIRFLDSSDPAFRGYDINIDVRIAGLAYDDPERLVHTQTPIPGIVPGDDVLIFGVQGPGLRGISAFGGCPPLVLMPP